MVKNFKYSETMAWLFPYMDFVKGDSGSGRSRRSQRLAAPVQVEPEPEPVQVQVQVEPDPFASLISHWMSEAGLPMEDQISLVRDMISHFTPHTQE